MIEIGFVSLNAMNEMTLQQASMPGIIRTILIIVAVYYAMKFLFRLLAPILMRKLVQKAEQNFRQASGQHYSGQQQYQNPQKPTSSKSENPRSTKKVGEYIDYEEIE